MKKNRGEHAMQQRPMARVAVWLAAMCAMSAGAAETRNFSPEQARTLHAIARDLFPQPELSDADFDRCILQADANAGSEQDREDIAGAMNMVEGALRRMGYQRYEDISDEYERVRMAKIFAERHWMRSFRDSMQRCLTGGSAQ
jgi:hypothetical protein